jgi:hypothetical protein
MSFEAEHRHAVWALDGIAKGARFKDHVAMKNDFGRKIEVERGLRDGVRADGEFYGDEWDVVLAAFRRFGAVPPSRRIDACCREMLNLMSV